jgi:hypothetical protein
VGELSEANPHLSYGQLWALLGRENPDLVAYCAAIEEGRWPLEPPQGSGYALGKSATRPPRSTELVKAKKPKAEGGEVLVVYGASGEVIGLELVDGSHEDRLHDATQKLIDRTDGPLHRDVAKNLVLDAIPKLAGKTDKDDKLQAAQTEIKASLKAMQAADPSKSFRQCWESLQRSNPELFEPLPKSA